MPPKIGIRAKYVYKRNDIDIQKLIRFKAKLWTAMKHCIVRAHCTSTSLMWWLYESNFIAFFDTPTDYYDFYDIFIYFLIQIILNVIFFYRITYKTPPKTVLMTQFLCHFMFLAAIPGGINGLNTTMWIFWLLFAIGIDAERCKIEKMKRGHSCDWYHLNTHVSKQSSNCKIQFHKFIFPFFT